jgi:PAS domain S-box-containing protein
MLDTQSISSAQTEKELVHILWQAVDQSASTVVLTDLNGTIKYVNPKFLELTGYSLPEILGKNPRVLNGGNTSPEVYKQMWKTIRRGEKWKGELQNRRKNGQLYWESITISPVRNQGDEVTHFLAIEEDITERKSLEERLEESMAELKRSNRELEGFTSMVAHDLVGPVGNIVNCIGLALEGNGSGVDKEMLTFAQDAAKKAGCLIHDLLEYSRIGGMKHTTAKVDVREILGQVLENLSFEMKKVGAKVIVGALPAITCSKLLVTQLFQNLIANAVKYRAEVPPEIKISASPQGESIVFNVEDNGIGMESHELERIFEPFYRIPSSSGRPGTGIGLATCQKIMRIHGGEIWAESEKGKGSRFYFTFPVA